VAIDSAMVRPAQREAGLRVPVARLGVMRLQVTDLTAPLPIAQYVLAPMTRGSHHCAAERLLPGPIAAAAPTRVALVRGTETLARWYQRTARTALAQHHAPTKSSSTYAILSMKRSHASSDAFSNTAHAPRPRSSG
jgi:hypothetical protein